MHAELRVDETVVMIAEASDNYPAFPVWLHVYVRDVDATYRKALDAGGVAVQEPVRKEGDPHRRGGFKDPSGPYMVDRNTRGIGKGDERKS
jgi:PhnB protein